MLPPYYRIEMFGGLCLVADGRVTVRLHSEAAEALLGLLAYRPEARFRRAELCRILWPHLAAPQATLMLHAALSVLRSHLEPASVMPGRVLCQEGDQIFLAPGTFETDVMELRAALALTGPMQSEAIRRQALIRALLLYAGELMAGMNTPWVAEERERWAIIHAAVKFEWAKLPPLAPPAQRETPTVGWRRDMTSRPTPRHMAGPRR